MEKLICSAIWFPLEETMLHLPTNLRKGLVIGGRRHHEILEVYRMLDGKHRRDYTQGFLTTENRFVDRIEGLRIALESEQVLESETANQLYSEDLY